jgi:TPR repeat protein
MRFAEESSDRRYEEAAYAYTIGDFRAALASFSELVKCKNSLAAAYLAEMYLRGEGTPPDVEKGLALLVLATSWGNGDAAYNLGALHRTGVHGVPKDPKKSRQFFVLARELGCRLSVD